ncbi:MAG: TatD family hydrolase [Sedimentisphaerales bacterium]|jgi:TatD DNase family protein|nr:TatD family hydrolase [Sedimentisphaerales bacterium]
MIIDTHCHLTYPELASQIEQVIARSTEAGVDRWITVGTDKEHWQRSLDQAARIPGLFVALGLHPHHARSASLSDMEVLRARLAEGSKVCAIGETGLDLHYPDARLDEQLRVFTWHLQMAADLGLPLVVHSRDAFDLTLEQLRPYKDRIKAIVLHCFNGTVQQARQAVDLGLYVSFSGIVTFKNAGYLRKVVAEIPLEQILVETDCPYLSPEPVRRCKVNEPAFLVHTIQAMADLRGIRPEQLAEVVSANASRVFGIG